MSLLVNSFTDFTVVFLTYSTIPVRFCTCCCKSCLSISAACTIIFKRFSSSSASFFSSIALVEWLFDSFSLAARLALSFSNCLITVVKLISELEAFYSLSVVNLLTKNMHTSSPCVLSSGVFCAAMFDSGARIASNDTPTPRYSSR
jgi:hypothetical protein